MALRPWEFSRHEISVKPEPSLPRGSQNWLGSCYKLKYLVLSVEVQSYFKNRIRYSYVYPTQITVP